MNQLSGNFIKRFMRAHNKTILGLSQSMNITQARVRQVRAQGVKGEAFVLDWLEAIRGA